MAAQVATLSTLLSSSFPVVARLILCFYKRLARIDMKITFVLGVSASAWPRLAVSFSLCTLEYRQRRPTTVDAKRGGKTTKRGSGGGSAGGFGGSPVTERKTDDYAIFPRLEPKVLSTLQPTREVLPAGPLPHEIYQRLDQIYGFPYFNYERKQEETESLTTSGRLSDLLAESKSPTVELNDLLGSRPSNNDARSEASPPDLAIDSLPPFEQFRVLHVDPLVLAIDDFFTDEECERYIDMSNKRDKKVMQSRSPTVGKDAVAKAQRTSTTWYHHYHGVPELMAKASRLLGLDRIDHWEEPQTVRYRRNEKFTWHLDALGPNENQQHLGGQRTATLLCYLTDMKDDEGGATLFRDLGSDGESLRVQPRKGSALLFFPAAGGIPDQPFDIRTLHCGEAVAAASSSDKWISQLWLRSGTYKPTAPPGNAHLEAAEVITEYCRNYQL